MSIEYPEERLIQKAERQYQYGDYLGGVETLKEALSFVPDNNTSHSLLSIGLVNLKRVNAALYEAKLGLNLEPNEAFGHYALGIAYRSMQKYKQALNHFEQALTLSPYDSDYHISIGNTYQMMGENKKAKTYFDKALEISPDYANAFAELGDWYLAERDYEKARNHFREALEMEPQNHAALLGMGYLFLLDGDIEEARNHAVWILQQDANHTGALHLLASVKAKSNFLLGPWWNINAWFSGGSTRRTITLLISAYILFQLVSIVLSDFGYPTASSVTNYFWIGVVIYSWVGPAWFTSSLKKELKQVTLKDDF